MTTANQPTSLDELAREINDILGREKAIIEDFAEREAAEVEEHRKMMASIATDKASAIEDMRLNAGRLLIEAQSQVEPGGWKKWVKANVKRSLSDCYQCMKVAGAADPEKERAKEKANTRERVQKHRDAKRAKATTTTSVTPPVTDENPEAPVWVAALASTADPRIKAAKLPVIPTTNEISEPTPSAVDELVKTTYAAFNTFTEEQRKEYAQRIGLWTRREEDGQIVCGVCNELAMVGNASHRCRPPEIDRETMLQVWFMQVKQSVTNWWQEYSDPDFREAFCDFVDELRQGDTPTSSDAAEPQTADSEAA